MSKKTKMDIALKNLKGFVIADDIKPSRLIPTGIPELDYALTSSIVEERKEMMAKGIKIDFREEESNGGFPSGKLVMIYGGEGSGKSSIAYRVCGNAQKQDMLCAWYDIENSFSNDLAKINELDISYNFIIKDPSSNEDCYAESILDSIIEVTNSGLVDVIVVDSVAALVPKKVYDSDASQDTIALLARVLGKTLGKLAQAASINNVLVIFINQLRVNPAVLFGNPEGCPGGNALKHFCSVICKMEKMRGKNNNIYLEDDLGNKSLLAGKSRFKVEKNRFAIPQENPLIIPIYYKPYRPTIDDYVFEFGRQLKIISIRLGVFKWESNNISIKENGKHNFIESLKEKDLYKNIIDEIASSAKEEKIILPRELLSYKPEVVKKSKSTKKSNINLVKNNNVEL